MPIWVAPVPRSTALLGRRAIDRFSVPLLYSQPGFKALSRAQYASTRAHLTAPDASPRRPILRSRWTEFRYASTHVSPTEINAPSPKVLPGNEELYNALEELNVRAERFVNPSRLQLALRGLSSQEPVTRVAILGLSGQQSAQRLARLLLADPLASEAQWERKLETLGDEEGKPILLQYGDENDAHPPNPLFTTLSVPSRVLRAHNVEILVSTLNTNMATIAAAAATESSQDAILVPKLQAPSGTGVPVPFPVHKTIVVGEGIESAVEYGRYTHGSAQDSPNLVKVAIDLPAPQEETEAPQSQLYTPVNVEVGTKALASFRQSIANSVYYEQGWFRSGLPSISKWLVDGLQPPASGSSAIVKNLIASIVDDTEATIMNEDTQQLEKAATSATQQQVSQSILDHLQTWAEKSHTELRDQLDEAFTARNWQKLAWWKLFWRVDDVAMITSEILERRWLLDAEKNCIYLAGRMEQAGLPTTIALPVRSTKINPAQGKVASAESVPMDSESASQARTIETSPEVAITPLPEEIPWPTHIPTERISLLDETIPPLQALAQRLVLTTLSTTSISSALSTLLYVSMPTFSLFEAGAVAALGLMYSLRRMQKLWEGAREVWQSEVREEGRIALKHTEELVREIVRRAERPEAEDEGVKERRVAREEVEKVKMTLERLGNNKL